MSTKIMTGAALSMVLLAQSTTSTFALTPNATARPMMEQRMENRQDRQEMRQENREDRQEMRQDNREERQEMRQENRQERRDTILENTASRVDARFTRHEQKLQNWIDRASKQVSTQEGKGKDVASAKKAIETAKASLASATKLGDEAVAKLRAVTPENWSEQKTDAVSAREAVKKAQDAYAQVVKDLQLVVKELKATK